MKKTIGMFSGYYIPHTGGVERYTDKLSQALTKLGYRVVIVTSNHDNLPNVETLGERKIYRLPIRSFAKNRYPIPDTNAEYKELVRQIEAEKFDYYFVNTRFHLTSYVGARMGKRFGRPVMLVEHGTGHFTVNNSFLDFFGKIYEHVLTFLIKRYVTTYYGVSQKCNEWLKHYHIRAAGVFYNSVDIADKQVPTDYYKDTYDGKEIVVSYIGRLIKEKGILNLLEAFKEVQRKNPSLRLKLVVAGDGDLLESIKRDYKDPAIDILGRLDFAHVKSLFKHTDVFVYPSLYPEGLPTSILEAGLMGCAVVATPRGGTEEVITNGRHGIITDGSVEDLYKSLNTLVTDPGKRKALGGALRSRVEDVFNWGAVAKQVDQEVKKFNSRTK